MKKICINDVEYPLCMTVEAADAFEQRYQKITQFADAFQNESIVGRFKEVLWQIEQLMRGGRDYAALTHCMEPVEDVLTEHELGILCPIRRINELQKVCIETVYEGLLREVETEPDRKNGKATQSKKR